MTEAPNPRAARTAAAGVAIVALTAAVISFSHVRQLALDAWESELASWLLPVSIDGAIAAAVAVILADSRAGRRSAGLTWMLLALGLAGSLTANIASAEPTLIARAVAAWPPVALALGIEVLAGLARRRDHGAEPLPAVPARPALAVRQRAAVGQVSAAADSAHGTRATGSTGVGNSQSGSRGARTGQSGSPGKAHAARPARGPDRRPHLDDAEAVALIRQLDAASRAGRASRLEIQKRLGCGGSRAARLADLARQP